MRQHSRLPGSRAGEDEERSLNVGDGLALRLIQARQDLFGGARQRLVGGARRRLRPIGCSGLGRQPTRLTGRATHGTRRLSGRLGLGGGGLGGHRSSDSNRLARGDKA